MNKSKWLRSVAIRNLLGVLALSGVYFVSDYSHLQQRTGFNTISPYIFLLLLYGWIVFHNRVLFERLYLQNKKSAYFRWTTLVIAVSSFNMHFILRYAFDIRYTLPQILTFWVYTITGLGVYVIFRYVTNLKADATPVIPTSTVVTHFNCVVDGVKQQIPVDQILYIESLENYIKVITIVKSYLVRLPMKDAEESLPKPAFIRISRSHIVNTSHIATMDGENVNIRDQRLKVGKVYKRYVKEQLNATRIKSS